MTNEARLALYHDLIARVEAALADGAYDGPEKASAVLGGFAPGGVRCVLIAVSFAGVPALDFGAVAIAAAPYLVALARPDLAAVKAV